MAKAGTLLQEMSGIKLNITKACRIEFFGGFQVLQEDRLIDRFQTHKTAVLLAYLGLHPGRRFSRDAVATMLWPGGDAIAIRNRLNQAVSSLRRQLHPPGTSKNYLLVADHHHIGLDSSVVSSDVSEFIQASQAALSAEDPAKATELRRFAADLYRGPLLDGFKDDWCTLERIRHADSYLDLLSNIIKYCAAEGDLETAIDYASRRLIVDPQNEKSHRTLMRLYLKAGRPSSALAQFQEFQRFAMSSGREPSEQILQLAKVAEHAGQGGVSGVSPVQVPLAPQRAIAPPKRVREPESDIRPSKLPGVPTRFFDRVDEMKIAVDSLEGPDYRIVTLLGLGGVGKTRLALKIAEDLRSRQSWNVYFVPFEGVGPDVDPVELIHGAIATQVVGDRDMLQYLAGLLKDIPRVLVVLDNLEGLTREQTARLTEVVGAVPCISFLGTSTQPLRLYAERVINVGALPAPSLDRELDLAYLAENPAVALFVDRAQQVRQDFQLTARTAGAIARLVRSLEGMPLALELAASWSRTLTPQQMLDQVTEDFDRLHNRQADRAGRHGSMGRALDASFGLLSPEEQYSLLSLGVFQGEFDREAAIAIGGDQEVDVHMQSHVDRMMVQAEQRENTMVYSMLSTLRAYTSTRIGPGQDKERRERHAQHLLARLKRLPPISIPSVDDWTFSLADLNQALLWFMENGSPEEMREYATCYAGFVPHTSHVREPFEHLETFVESVHPGESADWALFWIRYARVKHLLGYFEEALAIMERFVQEFDLKTQLLGYCEGQIWHAMLLHSMGNYEGSRDILLSLSGHAEQVPPAMRARIKSALGNSLSELHDWEAATDAYTAAVSIGRSSNDVFAMVVALGNLSSLMRLRGKAELAIQLAEEALTLSEVLPLPFGRTAARLQLLEARIGAEQLEEAQELLAVLTYSELLGAVSNDSVVVQVARLFMKLGEPTRALELASSAQAAIVRHGLVEKRSLIQEDLRDVLEQLRGAMSEDAYANHKIFGELRSADDLVVMVRQVINARVLDRI